MQSILGLCLITCGVVFVNYIVTWKPPKNNVSAATYKTPTNNSIRDVDSNPTDHTKIEINLPRASKYRHTKSSYTNKAVNRLLYLIRNNRDAVQTVVSACSYYKVPFDVCLTLWWLESGMELDGDEGGAGGGLAFKNIDELSYPKNSKRWKRFRVNKHDLLAIANHCGFNPYRVKGSQTGALGPFQFMPSTWIKIAIDADGDGRACPLNLKDSAYGAAKFISNLQKKSGSWNNAIQTYSGGSSVYMHRSLLVRRRFCSIMRNSIQTRQTSLPCSIAP